MTRARALVLALALALLFLGVSAFAGSRRGLWPMGAWGRDEARQVEVAREAARDLTFRGLVVPRRNGEPCPDDPPLATWLILAAGRDVTPASARWPAVAAALAVLAATFWIGLRLVGPDGALRACLALVGCSGFLLLGTTAGGEALLAALEAAGVGCLFIAAFPPTAAEVRLTPDIAANLQLGHAVRRRLAASGLAVMGLGTLAGGPETVLVPLAVLGVFCGASRTRPRLGAAWVGLPLGLVPAGAWLLVALPLGGAGFGVRVIAGQLERFTEPFGGVAVGPGRLVLATLAALLPVGILVVPAVVEALRAEFQAHRYGVSAVDRLPTLFPLAWLATTSVLFLASPARRLSDVVPAFPAAALLIAWFFERPDGSVGRAAALLERAACVGVAALGVLLVPLAETCKRLLPWERAGLARPGVAWELLGPAALLVLSGVLGLRRSRAALPVLALGSLATFAALHVSVVPGVDPLLSGAEAARRFEQVFPPPGRVAFLGDAAPDVLLFETGRTLPLIARGDAAALGSWVRAGRGVVCSPEDATLATRAGARERARVFAGLEELVLLGE